MRSSSINNSPPPRLSQNLGTILSIGFGASIGIHLGLFIAISRWWQTPRATQEPIEITLVAPVAPPVPVSHPPAAISPKPIPFPKPKVLAPAPKPIPTSTPVIQSISKPPTPIVAKPALKPIKITPKSKPKPIALKRPPQAIRVAVTPRSKSISPPPFNLPFPTEPSPAIATKPIPKPAPPQVKVKSKPTPPVNSPVPIDRPTPTAVKPSIASNPQPQTFSTPVPVEKSIPSTTATPTPSPAETPSNSLPILDRESKNPNQPKSGSASTENPLAGDRPANSLGGNSMQGRAAGGFLPGSGGQIDRTNMGGNPQGNLASPNGSNSATGNTGGSQNGNSTTGNNSSFGGTNSAGSGTSGLKCVRNCQIARLQNLQDSDGGKDRLRIRIVIDANGVVSAAEIAKSSGNPKIDTVVLDGIKQMQFNPPGKTIKGIIKANILL